VSSSTRRRGSASSNSDGSTIFRVAEEAGVSITTVSHVFSGKRHVSAATRQRVLAVADEIGYQPTASARALATRRTMTVALQHSVSGPEDMVNPFMGAMLTAMSETAMRASYSFLFVPPGPTAEIFVAPLVGERRIDGAILIDPTPDDPFVSALLEQRLPLVSLGRIEGHPELLSVDHDHPAIVRMALDHLFDVGYERPALMSLRTPMSLVLETEQTFTDLAGSGAPIVALGEFSERCAYEAALRLLGGRQRPDAIFCVNDLFALGVVHAARELGVMIPDDLGIVGVGDSPASRGTSVPLTSVRVYPELAGVRLFEGLLSLLAELPDTAGASARDHPEPLPAELVLRESTARP
jgi:DNA-binding LacI/PurR family transcriptional regulator